MEALSWEKRSSFSHNRYLEEAEKLSKPGSVTQMRAHFEAHFKKKGIRFPSSIEAQTWREVVQHHQVLLKHRQEQDKYDDQEISQLRGDSCVSYDDNNNSGKNHTNRAQQTSRGQAKARDDAQEQSSKACCDRSMACGPVKSNFNVNKQRDMILIRV